MKKSIFNVAMAVFTLCVIFTSCSPTKDKVEDSKEAMEEAQEDLDKAKQTYEEEYNKFKLESEEKITANEKLIEDLKAYSKDKKKEVKLAYDLSIESLEAKNQALRDKVANYNEKESEKWESFKREFNHDMENLGKAIKDIGVDNTK